MTDQLLDAETDDAIRVSVADAQGLAERALATLGYSAEEATTIATHLVDASMWGYEFAGLPRILVIAERAELKRPRVPLSVVKETPVSALVDGGNNIGYVTMPRVAELAIEKVRHSGVAMIGMRNSWFAGRNAYYLENIARAGFGAIYAGSSAPTVVPPGARQKALGTNPMVIALPRIPHPFIFDMGTASVMSGELLMKAFLGEDFEEPLGIDGEGKPTRSARGMLEGGVFPFGGHKGYGLSLAVQALGLLAGAKMRNGEISDFGYFLLAFDPQLFMPLAQFTSELEELLAKVKGLPRQTGAGPVRVPSERGFHEREIRRRQGILVKRRVLDKLQEMLA